MLSSILGCHNDSLVLLVLFEDIHIRTGSVSVLGVRQSSSWHPEERLELTHIMLCSGVTRQAVSGLAGPAASVLAPAWIGVFINAKVLMNGSILPPHEKRQSAHRNNASTNLPLQDPSPRRVRY
jgi:hypothetical protein